MKTFGTRFILFFIFFNFIIHNEVVREYKTLLHQSLKLIKDMLMNGLRRNDEAMKNRCWYQK